MGTRLINLVCWTWLKNTINPFSRHKTTLLSLPTELLQQIAHCLPPESVMSFALASMWLHDATMYMDPISLLSDDLDARNRFLHLLRRDFRYGKDFRHGYVGICEWSGQYIWWKKEGDILVSQCPHSRWTWGRPSSTRSVWLTQEVLRPVGDGQHCPRGFRNRRHTGD